MSVLKVLVCGGRDYSDREAVERHLGTLAATAGRDGATLLLIHGNAPGADRLCGLVAAERGIHSAAVSALWDRYGNSAGPIRNSAMLALGPDMVLVFPGGRGTADMVRQAAEAGVPFEIVGGDGELV